MVRTDFTIEYWRGRAEEARTIAEQMRDPEARNQMMSVAEGYEHLAASCEARMRRGVVI